MKTLLFILLFFSALVSHGKKKEAKYFLMNDGSRQNFSKFDHLTDDTLFLINGSSQNYLPIDSMKALHVYCPSHALGAGITGFFVGIIFGTLVGAAVTPNGGEFSKAGGAFAGALIGCGILTTLGILAGAKDQKQIDIDFGNYNKEERLKMLPNLLKDL